MTALFLPLLFTARSGAVFFDGQAIPPLRCIAIREKLNYGALDRSQSQRSADLHWSICQQLRAAMTEARRQREAGKHLYVITNTPPRAA